MYVRTAQIASARHYNSMPYVCDTCTCVLNGDYKKITIWKLYEFDQSKRSVTLQLKLYCLFCYIFRAQSDTATLTTFWREPSTGPHQALTSATLNLCTFYFLYFVSTQTCALRDKQIL